MIVVREGAYLSNILEVILQSRSYGISLEIDGRRRKEVKSLIMMTFLKKKKKKIEGFFAWDNLRPTEYTE